MKPRKLSTDYVCFDKETGQLKASYQSEKDALNYAKQNNVTLYKITTHKYN